MSHCEMCPGTRADCTPCPGCGHEEEIARLQGEVRRLSGIVRAIETAGFEGVKSIPENHPVRVMFESVCEERDALKARCEQAESLRERCEAYVVSLQRIIEAHVRGEMIAGDLADASPHLAERLNAHLQQGRARCERLEAVAEAAKRYLDYVAYNTSDRKSADDLLLSLAALEERA